MDLGFTSERLVFNRLNSGHARGDYLKWMNDPLVTEYLISETREYGAGELAEYIDTQNRDQNVLLLGAFLKDGERHIGNIKLRGLAGLHRRADMGIIIGDPELWGKGYATEAIRRVTEYSFTTLNLHKIEAGCLDLNTGSLQAFKNAGFKEEGLRRGQFLYKGQWIDEVLLAALVTGNS